MRGDVFKVARVPHRYDQPSVQKPHAVPRPGGDDRPVVLAARLVERRGDFHRLRPRKPVVVAHAMKRALVVFHADKMNPPAVHDEHGVVGGVLAQTVQQLHSRLPCSAAVDGALPIQVDHRPVAHTARSQRVSRLIADQQRARFGGHNAGNPVQRIARLKRGFHDRGVQLAHVDLPFHRENPAFSGDSPSASLTAH